jgi:tetratricopeptide (TPR) repeat protein
MAPSKSEKEIQAGQKLMADGEYSKALKKFNNAIQMDPKNPLPYFLKAECGVGVPKLTEDEILESYNKAIELESNNPFFYSAKGAFCLETGKWSLAEEAYTKAAKIDDENRGRYYSEFGVEYYYAMINKFEGQINDSMLNEIKKKAVTYLLKSIDTDTKEITKLFK